MSGRIRAQGRDRDHRHPRRPRLVRVRLGEDEYAALAEAARASGLTPTGFAAEAALAAARRAGQQTPKADVEAVRELMMTRTQLRRYGNNLNQAARALNAGGDPPEWLRNAIALTNRVVERIDRAAQSLGRAGRSTDGGRFLCTSEHHQPETAMALGDPRPPARTLAHGSSPTTQPGLLFAGLVVADLDEARSPMLRHSSYRWRNTVIESTDASRQPDHPAVRLILLGSRGDRVLLPAARYGQFEDDLQRLCRVTNLHDLRRFLLERPELGQYAGGPGDPSDPDWAEEWRDRAEGEGQYAENPQEDVDSEADEKLIPWSVRYLDDGDYPFPLPYEALALSWLEDETALEDLVADLFSQGCLQYEEVGGPLDWLTVPENKVQELVALVANHGHELEVTGSEGTR